ncbi:hypothetical protein L6452_02885 [Arctium lappa]|uniref:Uncharacterized protein n=1 Tax=Arctium lappa TaxID=4217 RepID=A0ACB9FLA1_ARCLA|nr:hypothetical protein L6452_02885 [Arctium lappa]
MKNLSNPNEFPTRKQVLDAGRVDLVNAITKTGGWLMADFGLGVLWRYDAYNPYSGSISLFIKMLHPLVDYCNFEFVIPYYNPLRNFLLSFLFHSSCFHRQTPFLIVDHATNQNHPPQNHRSLSHQS